MTEFNPALPLPIKWNIGDDRFNEGQQVLNLTIPVESVTHLIDHLQNLVNTKAKEAEVYDFTKKQKVKTNCVQIFSKAMDGQYGVFGNINPQKIENAPNTDELLFNMEAFVFVRFDNVSPLSGQGGSWF